MKKQSLLAIPILALCFRSASADQVISDDLVVDGSACLGFDCVTGESFGFRTLILKENNTRIYFHDTSNAAGFPTTDWQLAANDSASGGDNRFSIEDATADTIPFTVQGDTGWIGMGTSTPETNLHVSGPDTPTMRYEQTGEQGWEPQVWETGANEGHFFVRDVTSQTRPLRIESAAVDDALVVHADGNVTITGTLAQGSSRGIKNVFPLMTKDVLSKLKTVEVARWQYKNDAKGSLHMGPMAEDFYTAFGLGADNKHITSSDVAGVAMASVQALVGKIDTQTKEIEQLQRDNQTLEKRLERLEKRLSE